MTIHHTLYRKMTILIPILLEVPQYAKPQVPGHRPDLRHRHSTLPNGLIPTDTRCNPVQLPEPTHPLTFTRTRRQTTQKLGTSGR
jgi:hypothetical protein